MTTATDTAHLLFLLWQASWQGGGLALLAWGVCRIVRVSPRTAAVLWWGVLLKFLLGLLLPLLFGEIGLPVRLPALAQTAPTSAVSAAIALPSWIFTAIAALWGAGVLTSLGLLAYRARRAARAAWDGSRPLPIETTAPVMEALREIAERLQLDRYILPTVRISDTADGPQIIGPFSRPVILLPASLIAPSPEALTGEELRLILAHEMAHMKRGDLWTSLIPAFAECLFYFHPLVRLARREWEAAREEACDAMALTALGEEPQVTQRYGALLLRLGSGLAFPTRPSVTALRLLPSPFRALHRRLSHLERWREDTGLSKKGRFTPHSLLAALVVVALLIPLRPEMQPSDNHSTVAMHPSSALPSSVSRRGSSLAIMHKAPEHTSHDIGARSPSKSMISTSRQVAFASPQTHSRSTNRISLPTPKQDATLVTVTKPKPKSIPPATAPISVTPPTLAMTPTHSVPLPTFTAATQAELTDTASTTADTVSPPIPVSAQTISHNTAPAPIPSPIASTQGGSPSPVAATTNTSNSDTTSAARPAVTGNGILRGLRLPHPAPGDPLPSRSTPITRDIPQPIASPTPLPETPLPEPTVPRLPK